MEEAEYGSSRQLVRADPHVNAWLMFSLSYRGTSMPTTGGIVNDTTREHQIGGEARSAK